MLTAAVLLGIMILPTIINLSESALNAVPNSYYEGALALGSTHEHATFFAVLPAAKSGILAAAVLGIGRAIGGQSGAHPDQHSARRAHDDRKHRIGNGLRNRSASAGIDCNRRGAVCLYSDYQHFVRNHQKER